jgi:hypothetical protein
MVVQLLQAAVAAGVPQEQIGVISPYRSQVCGQDACPHPGAQPLSMPRGKALGAPHTWCGPPNSPC